MVLDGRMVSHIRNKELSWLAFNERVLQEASDRSVPLIERLRFLGIYSSNQDEFFRVRVAALHRLVRLGKKGKKLLGSDPKIVIAEVKSTILQQQEVFQKVYEQLLHELSLQGIHLVTELQLSSEQRVFVQDYFRNNVRSQLTPLMLSAKKLFPSLRDKSIYLATKLCSKGRKVDKLSLIEVPTDSVSRFLVLPPVKREQYVVLLEDVVRCNVPEIFSLFKYDFVESHLIKVTRDAELDLDDDVTESYLHKVVKGVKHRKGGSPVRLVYDQNISVDFLEFLKRKLKIRDDDSIVPGGRTHNFKDFIDFPQIGRPTVLASRKKQLSVPAIKDSRGMLRLIRNRDLLLHFPYQSFEEVIALLQEAAIDPKVITIKITLYRVARHSGVVNALVNAARNGKRVTVVVELQARFNEEANVALANKLQDEGVVVIFGVPGLKVHAKIGLIVRKESGRAVRYAFLGTGNFNEDTSIVYSDHCLFTSDRRLTREVAAVFDFFQNNYRVPAFNHLMVAPFGLRRSLIELIEYEIRQAEIGKRAEIDLKLNNLTDPVMIELLYRAADAGVRIRLNIRGMYCVVPHTLEHQNQIQAIAIVDSFLEHSRIYRFHHKGKEKVLLSSGDWMTRNLDRRVEVAFPIYEQKMMCEVMDFFEIQWKDNVKARVLDAELQNHYRKRTGKAVRSQNDLYDYLSSNKPADARKYTKKQLLSKSI